MKRRILTIALLLSLSITSTFANNKEEVVNYRAQNSFKQEFAQARNVKWETSRDFVKATFSMNDQVMIAYYSNGGNLLGVTRNITTNQLPLNLLTDIKKNHKDSWISDLFEVTTKDETSYYITLQDADQTIVLKSIESTGWTSFKKEKKDN
jgi:hypothetical protein